MVQLFNARSQSKERLRPLPGQPIRLYVCGITPYDTTHLGHAFTYVTFDLLIRLLRQGERWPVRYVQNLTDIDDDILRKAAETGADWRRLGLDWTERFRGDLAWLNLLPPDVYPGATSVMPRIIALTEALLAKGLAYESGGSVYFATAKDPDFATHLGLARAELLTIANERGNRPDDPGKRDPLDFVLWQAGKPGEPAWHSPWSDGRPGWHIECSAMALEHLGEQVDVHGGGADLAFPHHACEEAQASPLVARHPWVRFWVHVAMVEMDGVKMSKSLGNLVLVRRLAAEGHHPDQVRCYLLQHHYRSPWNWDPAQFAASEAWVRTLHAAAERPSSGHRVLDLSRFGPRVTGALEDDLNSPAALAATLELADAIIEAPAGSDLKPAQDLLRATAGGLLGLHLAAGIPAPSQLIERWPEPRIAGPDLILPSANLS